MAYTRPTLADFQEIFTAFPDVSQAQFDYWIERAERVIDAEFGDDQLHGTQLLTAHYLTTQGLGSEADSLRWKEFAGANQVKSGTLSLGWSDAANKATTGTRYGDEVRALIVSVKGGPKVTRTGAFPPVVFGYGGRFPHGYS